MVFLDLQQAFDRIIGAFALGLPPSFHGRPVAYLQSLGLSESDAQDLADEIAECGPHLATLGVPSIVCQLVGDLHGGCWFEYGQAPDRVVCELGARQGCRLGPLLFNMVYAGALAKLRQRLIALEDVVLLVGSLESRRLAYEATYVDDEMLCVADRSAECLDHKIALLMHVLLLTFSSFGLILNWGPNKTECMLHYKGKGACMAVQRGRGDDGSLLVSLPPLPTHLS